MEFEAVVRRRPRVRAYRPEPVKKKKVECILLRQRSDRYLKTYGKEGIMSHPIIRASLQIE